MKQLRLILPNQHIQTHNFTSAGQPDDHNSDCFPVIGLFPRTNLPDPEVPDIAAMSDGERRLWLASRCDPVVDQLPQARRTLDGYSPGDPQPGTQHKRAPCAGTARPAPESVAPAGEGGLLLLHAATEALLLQCGDGFLSRCFADRHEILHDGSAAFQTGLLPLSGGRTFSVNMRYGARGLGLQPINREYRKNYASQRFM